MKQIKKYAQIDKIQILFNGQKKSLKKWSKDVNIPQVILWNSAERLRWPVEKVLTTPIHIKKYNKFINV